MRITNSLNRNEISMTYYAKNNTSSVGGSMRLTPDAITQIISELNSVASNVDSLVNSIKTESINKINSSWIAGEAKTYVDKVELANTKINKVNEGLRLLAGTFDQTLKNMSSTRQSVGNDVNNI